jgi:hypothetical protein
MPKRAPKQWLLNQRIRSHLDLARLSKNAP